MQPKLTLPFSAGSAALILQAKGKGAARSVRTLLQTTAQTVPSSLTDAAPPQTLAQQGAGLINVNNAIHFTTLVTPGELLLNDTANFKGVHTITVKNTGKTRQTFKLSHAPVGTMIVSVISSCQLLWLTGIVVSRPWHALPRGLPRPAHV